MSEKLVSESDVEVRVEKSRVVADVRGGDVFVTDAVKVASEQKELTKHWDGRKEFARKIAREVMGIVEAKGHRVDAVSLLSKDGTQLEVCASTQRKALGSNALVLMEMHHIVGMVQDNVEVTLTGPLAAWAITALGNREGDPNFSVKREMRLVPEFEERRRAARANKNVPPEVWDQLTSDGIFAPRVEAKIRKG